MNRIAGLCVVFLSLCSCQLAFATVGSWTAAGGPPTPITTSYVVTLADGRVAAFGGFFQGGQPRNQTLLYDPSTMAWTNGAVMPGPAFPDVVARLADGTVLVEGGRDENGNPSGATWLYDASRNSWSQAGSVIDPRSGPGFTLLSDGRLLIAGGGVPIQNDSTGFGNNFTQVATAEIYDSSTRKWSQAGHLLAARSGIALVALPGGRALAAGGCVNINVFPPPAEKAAEVFEPSTATWTSTSQLPVAMCAATAVALRDGRALVVDQAQFANSMDVAYTYDPRTHAWSMSGDLVGGGSTAVMLKDGRVLIPETRQGAPLGHTFAESVGGQIFDPAANQWTYITTTSVKLPLVYLDQTGYGSQTSASLPDGSALVFLPTETLVYHPQVPPPATQLLDSTGLTFELGAAAVVIVLLLLLAYRRAVRSDLSKVA